MNDFKLHFPHEIGNKISWTLKDLTKNSTPNRILFLVYLIKVENQISTYNPQGFIIVYAVDDESSVDVAEQILIYLKSEEIIENQAVILVANKTDLVRSREVSSNGKKRNILII